MPITRVLTRSISVALAAAVMGVLPLGTAQAADTKAMIEKNGCVACHGFAAKDAKKMGPNFGTIAAKYAKDKKAAGKLADKIRKGGSGSFGTMPMPPQAQVTPADAKAMAEWVLKQK